MSMMQKVVAQFKQPHGYLGQLAGIIMANRPSNIERNNWTLDLLDLTPDDRVLEIGFGPGIAIEKASQVIKEGRIVGVDHSETMLHQASKRNAAAIRQGVVELLLASVDNLPPFSQPFTKIYSANVVQFWDNMETSFAHLYEVLAPGGRIATTYMPRHKGATPADTVRMAERVSMALNNVGFDNIRVKEKPLKPFPVMCVLAEK